MKRLEIASKGNNFMSNYNKHPILVPNKTWEVKKLKKMISKVNQDKILIQENYKLSLVHFVTNIFFPRAYFIHMCDMVEEWEGQEALLGGN